MELWRVGASLNSLKDDMEVSAMVALLSREWGHGDIPVTEAVPAATITTELLVLGGARVVYLHQDLESYLTVLLAKHREAYGDNADGTRGLQQLRSVLPKERALPAWKNMTMAMRIGLDWVGNILPMARSLHAQSDNIYALNLDSFLADPSSHLRRFAQFWDVAEYAHNAEALSKDIFQDLRDEDGSDFDLTQRVKDVARWRAEFATEVTEGFATAKAVIEKTHLKEFFSSFGKCMYQRCEHYNLPPHMLDTLS